MIKKIVLASQSPYRKELLSRLNLTFETSPANVDENLFKEQYSDVEKLTEVLAQQKAKKVSTRFPDHLVIGSDQALALDQKIYSKPGTVEMAMAQLEELAGKTHRLVTSVCMLSSEVQVNFTHNTFLTMRDLSKDEIQRYVLVDDPVDCAGSYKIEGLGISLFESIEGGDYTSIIGLPLIQLGQALRELGYSIP